MTDLQIAIAVYVAYLIGSFSSAIIVCKLMRLPDPRKQGSGNPGATNVLRIGNKKAALLTLFGDVLKGFLPVILAKWLGFDTFALGLIALGAFLGHLFPIFFRFEGGKGVATLIGCLFALSWPLGICFLITWLVIGLTFRYSSLAAIIAALLAPLYTWYFTAHLNLTLVVGAMSILLILRHHSNIRKLIRGEENKIGKKLK